jgi:chromosome segregation ATPase
VSRDIELKSAIASCKNKQEEVRQFNLQIENLKKKHKKLENEKITLKTEIKDYETTLKKIGTEKEDINSQILKANMNIEEIICEQRLLTDKNFVLNREDEKVKADIDALKKNIQEQEGKLRDLKKTEADAVMTIKNLTTLRGSCRVTRNHGPSSIGSLS